MRTITGTDQDGRVGTASFFTAGVDTVALMAGISSVQTSNITYSVAGTTVSNKHFDGARVSATAADITFTDCVFRGDNSLNALFTCTNIAAKRIKFIRCWFVPKFPANKNAINGHDFELYDCLVEKTTDGLSVNNSSQFAATGAGWACGVILRRTIIRRLARWTAATTGVVHTSDSVSHNDCIQIFGGVGMDIEDCVLDAAPARQFAHLYLRDAAGHVYTEAEAYALADNAALISVPMGSLSDGGPFAFPGDATHPPRPLPWESNGTGLLSRGALNMPDYSCIMLNNTQGYTAQHRIVNTLFLGGEYAINGGGNPSSSAPAGVSLGTWTGLRFDRSQGAQGQTVNFGGTWTGRATVSDCKYLDGTPVTVRY
jgi:hypothetical protein